MPLSLLEGKRRVASELSALKEIGGKHIERFATQIVNAIHADMEIAAKQGDSLVHEALKDAIEFQKKNIFGLFRDLTEQKKMAVGTKILHAANSDESIGYYSEGNQTELGT